MHQKLNELHDRIDNVRRNIAVAGNFIEPNDSKAAWKAVAVVAINHLADIGTLAVEVRDFAIPTDMTDQEYDDIQALAKMAERHSIVGDGLDHDLVVAIQAAQRIIMLRVGSRHWQAVHEARITK